MSSIISLLECINDAKRLSKEKIVMFCQLSNILKMRDVLINVIPTLCNIDVAFIDIYNTSIFTNQNLQKISQSSINCVLCDNIQATNNNLINILFDSTQNVFKLVDNTKSIKSQVNIEETVKQ